MQRPPLVGFCFSINVLTNWLFTQKYHPFSFSLSLPNLATFERMLCTTTTSSSGSGGNSRMEVKNLIVSLILFNFAILAIGAAPRKPVDVVFHRNYVPSWSPDHIKYLNGGYTVDLLLDKYSGLCVCCSLHYPPHHPRCYLVQDVK